MEQLSSLCLFGPEKMRDGITALQPLMAPYGPTALLGKVLPQRHGAALRCWSSGSVGKMLSGIQFGFWVRSCVS